MLQTYFSYEADKFVESELYTIVIMSCLISISYQFCEHFFSTSTCGQNRGYTDVVRVCRHQNRHSSFHGDCEI